MAIYYINQGQDYLSDSNYNFFTTSDNEGPDLHRYKPMLYINGRFREVKSYVKKILRVSNTEGLKTVDNKIVLTVHNQVFMPNDNSQIVAISSGEILTKDYYTRVSPYIIHGMIVNTIPYGALTNDNEEYLLDNYDRYLTSD